ncbi:LysM peptidoglycan-binding domain-containing protein [Pandoraea pneumonica]|uniref:LysM peptidoglycan-binding domain-containing protein n=1 Tax=Pandoraea pneumonica TaxID=2508299 RepID=UPI003CF792B1
MFDHTEWTSVWGVIGTDEAGNPEYGYISQPSAAYRTQYTAVNGLTTEAYDYDSNNRLSHVSRDGVLLDTRYYDGSNRVVQTGPAGALPQEYVTALNGAAGGNGSETRQSTYDQNGNLLHQKVTKSDGSPKYEVDYQQYDGAGNLVKYSMTNQDGDGYTNNYTYQTLAIDGYKEWTVSGTSTKFDPGTTTSAYDVNSNLISVTDSTKAENNRTFVNDAQGHVLYVNQGGHTQRQLVVDGEVLGRYGDMINPDAPQDPNTGSPNFINKADFSFGFQPINGKYPTGAPGAVAVQSGDTLESIAHSAFGDSKLWYLIAEANGLSGNADLRVGQTLTIPNRVSTIHNDNKTFKPYDPSAIIGDTTPNLPVPQADSGGGCGGLGTIIMIAVTVVVAVYTAGAAAFAMGAVQAAEGAAAASLSFGSAMSAGASAMLGGTAVGGLTVTGATIGGLSAAVGAAAIGGIAGSLAGQLAGTAMGIQNGISLNQLALSGLSAGIGAGVGSQIAGATIGASALRAAVTNVALQGVGVVTGLQSSFSWTSVAASAVGGAVGGALNAGGANSISQSINDEIGGLLGRTVSGVLVGTAAAATTSILRGGRIAIQQVAVDAFGNALGSSFIEQSLPKLPETGGG